MLDLGRHLQALCAKPERLAVGLMSGTSMDGIDAALVRVRGAGLHTHVELVAFRCQPYEASLRDALMRVASGAACTGLEWARLDFQVAASFAQAALVVIDAAGISPQQVDFIASHGQTLAHYAPGADTWDPLWATWQAGNVGVLAALAGILVVGDFRPADIALGGTGAPLVPYVDYLLRRSDSESRVLLNLGGIANLTFLPAGGTLDDVLAWDIGPGNMLLDAAATALLGETRDDAGRSAARGRAADAWVESLLAHEFFTRPAPKSAGREDFGGAYAQHVLDAARAQRLSPDDVLASLVELGARAIARALQEPPLAEHTLHRVYVSGGGRHNAALMRRLQALLGPLPISGIEALGIDADAKEAIDFAVLGNETLHGNANNVPQVTGAQRPIVLGAIAPAGLVPRTLAGA